MILIRELLEPDFDSVVAGWHRTNLVSYPYVQAHQEHSLEDARRFFRGTVLAECRVWIAERAAQPLGVLALCEPWIRQLAVFPPFQRQGIGTALLATARTHSPEELRLYTFQRNNAARAFYERHGFSAVAFGMSPAPESEPDVEYRWQRAHAFTPKGSSMFGYAPEESIVQVHGVGPFQINWQGGLKTLDDADAKATFLFARGDRVVAPRGNGRIVEGYASGTLIQYEIEESTGRRFMANEHDLRSP